MASTTLITVVPSKAGPFSFNPVLAGSTYSASIPYNLFGQRFYLNLTDLSGNPVHYCALVESGPSFPATLNWSLGTATVSLSEPHNVPIGQLVRARVSQSDSGFDGTYLMLATGATTLTYALPDDPDSEPIGGVLNFDINLVEGIIDDALLVYHADTQQIEYA